MATRQGAPDPGRLRRPSRASGRRAWDLDEVLAEHRPEILFHAVAYKHVPLMEGSSRKVVKNDVTVHAGSAPGGRGVRAEVIHLRVDGQGGQPDQRNGCH